MPTNEGRVLFEYRESKRIVVPKAPVYKKDKRLKLNKKEELRVRLTVNKILNKITAVGVNE